MAALAQAKNEHVPLLYWTAASWGLAIGLRTDLAIDLPSVRALAERGMRSTTPGTAARCTRS